MNANFISHYGTSLVNGTRWIPSLTFSHQDESNKYSLSSLWQELPDSRNAGVFHRFLVPLVAQCNPQKIGFHNEKRDEEKVNCQKKKQEVRILIKSAECISTSCARGINFMKGNERINPEGFNCDLVRLLVRSWGIASYVKWECSIMLYLNEEYKGSLAAAIRQHSPASFTVSPPPFSREHYFNFFLGLNWFVCPHFFFRQLVARGGRRAYVRRSRISGGPFISIGLWYSIESAKWIYWYAWNRRRWATNIAFSTNHLITIVLAGECFKTRLNDTAAKAENEMKGWFLHRFQISSIISPISHHEDSF